MRFSIPTPLARAIVRDSEYETPIDWSHGRVKRDAGRGLGIIGRPRPRDPQEEGFHRPVYPIGWGS